MDWEDFKDSNTMACAKGLSGAVGAVHRVKPEVFSDDRLAILVATTGCVVGIGLNEYGKSHQIDSATADFATALDGLASDAENGVRSIMPEALGNSIFGHPDVNLFLN